MAVHADELLSPKGHVFDRSAIVGLLQDPEVQRRIDVITTHDFPMSRATEAFEVGLSKNCGKIYLRPGE